jgi:hypothetical protein
MDQHANTFQARLPGHEQYAGGQPRNEILETVIETGEYPEAVGNRTKASKAVGKSEQTVLTGTALRSMDPG